MRSRRCGNSARQLVVYNARRVVTSEASLRRAWDGRAPTDTDRVWADHLDNWLDVVLHLYGDRVMPFDAPAARLAGLLMDRARTTGQAPGFADLAIAATAGVHGLTVLTRSVRHFGPLDIPAFNPFESLPDWPGRRAFE